MWQVGALYCRLPKPAQDSAAQVSNESHAVETAEDVSRFDTSSGEVDAEMPAQERARTHVPTASALDAVNEYFKNELYRLTRAGGGVGKTVPRADHVET